MLHLNSLKSSGQIRESLTLQHAGHSLRVSKESRVGNIDTVVQTDLGETRNGVATFLLKC